MSGISTYDSDDFILKDTYNDSSIPHDGVQTATGSFIHFWRIVLDKIFAICMVPDQSTSRRNGVLELAFCINNFEHAAF